MTPLFAADDVRPADVLAAVNTLIRWNQFLLLAVLVKLVVNLISTVRLNKAIRDQKAFTNECREALDLRFKNAKLDDHEQETLKRGVHTVAKAAQELTAVVQGVVPLPPPSSEGELKTIKPETLPGFVKPG